MVSQTTEENLNLISEADTDRIMISADQMQKYRIPKQLHKMDRAGYTMICNEYVMYLKIKISQLNKKI